MVRDNLRMLQGAEVQKTHNFLEVHNESTAAKQLVQNHSN